MLVSVDDGLGSICRVARLLSERLVDLTMEGGARASAADCRLDKW